MDIKNLIEKLRADKAVKEAELNALRAERDRLIADNQKFIERERELAKQIKAKQLELAPVLNSLGELRRESVRA
jgi:dynactin complex subunit